MNFSSSVSSQDHIQEEVSYELLDYQLADLMMQLNGNANQTLKDCTLKISKNTREGQIAYPCSIEQQTELLKAEVVGKPNDYQPLILDNGFLYLRRYWQYQQVLVDQIKKRLETVKDNKQKKMDWLDAQLNYYFDNKGDEFNWQKQAAKQALANDFLVLSGGPGTGKTTTITRILALLITLYNHQKQLKEHTSPLFARFVQEAINKKRSLRILLAAPTGKASIRMIDAIRDTQKSLHTNEDVLELMPTKATTIHKLLGYNHGKVDFKHNRNNPLNADVVIVDEASMIDIALMSKLIEAVPAHAKLILIGDKDQLSSVETGSVFADICMGLLESKEKNLPNNIVTLQKNWRFSSDSGIGQLSIATNRGDSNKVLEILQDDNKPECRLLSPSSLSTKLLPKILVEPWNNYFNVLNNPHSSISEIFATFNQYRILCALRQGLNGSTTSNDRIEMTLDKQGLIKLGRMKNKNWYHGRPVMITQNSYSKGLFNGDTGITLIRNGETKVYFPDGSSNCDGDGEAKEMDNFKSLSPIRLPVHETTWAMTIHKSQGSEFDHVTLVLPHEKMPLLTKQLIYTGATRTKEKLTVIADEDVLVAGIKSEIMKATKVEKMLVIEP